MAFELNESQKQAVEYNKGALLVSAGAGSGKTAVLVSRLMRYISEGEDINKFVIITFTKAAASELRTKISKELKKRDLKRQEALLSGTQIGTIHHFCSSILRENAHAVHINPDFRIISEERAEDMKATAIDKVMDLRYEKMAEYPGFEELVNTVGIGRNDETLMQLVLDLHNNMQCHAHPEKWAQKCVDDLNSEMTAAEDTIWGKEILKNAKYEAKLWSDEIDALMILAKQDTNIEKAYLPSLSKTGDDIREFMRCLEKGWDTAADAPAIEYPKFSSLRNYSDNEIVIEIKARRDALKKQTAKIKNVFDLKSDELLEDIKKTKLPMEALLQLTLDFDKAYSHEKKRLNMLDYNDLEHLAAAFLEENDISSKYTEIMVDEYQDVSRVQDEIFRNASDNGRKLFMVGDIKQSIYRFRLADPEIFKEKIENNESVHTIFLRENYRSRKEILDTANKVFNEIMTDRLGDTNYKENNLVFGAKDYAGNVDLPTIELIESQEDEDKTLTEAKYVSKRIEKLVKDNGVKFGDIAILLRNTSKQGNIFRKALNDRNIPVTFGQGGDFFEMTEVSSLISILRVMDNPHNDIPLIAALKSPFFGFTADELSEIRASDKDSDFYNALKKCSKTNEKVGQFLETLKKFRKLAPDMSEDNIIRMIMSETDAETICSFMNDGDARMANLMQLTAIAVRYELEGFHGLHRFIMYLDRLKEKGTDISTSGSNDTTVKIMSVHKSKGLEFPYVFLCNTNHKFNTSDSKKAVLIHPELGLGPKIVDNDMKIQYPSLARNAIAQRINRENLSEEMRLMYVALTRPKEHLVITGCVNDVQKTVDSSKQRHPMYAQSPLEWFLHANVMDVVKISESSVEEIIEGEELIKDESVDEDLIKDLKYEYPYEDAVELPSKVNATELKKYNQSQDDEAYSLVRFIHATKPEIGDKQKVSAAERGTATHLVLQQLDFNEDIDSEMLRLRDDNFITEKQAEIADIDAIRNLLASPIGRKIKEADNLHREFEFKILCDAQSLLGKGNGEQILLQGVVDCCIEEDDGLIIIDYKTDRVKSDKETDERAKIYKPQLDAYKMALERVFKKKVKETIIYFLSNGQLKYV